MIVLPIKTAIKLAFTFATSLLLLTSCSDKIEIQQHYDYALDIMPYPNTIQKGETIEIRCELITTENYDENRFTIRYFPVEGKGELRLGNNAPFKPNDRYLLEDNIFRLYYTSHSEESHHIDIYIEDIFGQVAKYSLELTNESIKDEDVGVK